MSNEMIPTNLAIPEHMLARMAVTSELAATLASGISMSESPPRISLKGSRFRLVVDGAETVLPASELNLVIVGANSRLSKVLYLGKYNPDSIAGPDCISSDGVRPDIAAENPQNDLCDTCPQNMWGSKIADNGTKLKACSDQKRLAVISPHDPTSVYLLLVTPTSMKSLNTYTKELINRGISPELVMTTFAFDIESSHPKLKFSFGGFNSPELQADVDNLVGSDSVLKIVSEVAAVLQTPPVEESNVVHISAPVETVVEVEPEPEPEETQAPAGFGAIPTAQAAPKAAKPKPTPKPKPAPVETTPVPTEATGFGSVPATKTPMVNVTPKGTVPAAAAKPTTQEALEQKIAAFALQPTDDG